LTTLYLVEKKDQVISFLKNKTDDKKILWIALSPFAMAELDKKGIQYFIPEDFYTEQELYQIGQESHRRILEFCTILDQKLNTASEISFKKLKPALFNIYPLTIAFDTVVSKVFQIERLIEEFQPKRIYIHDNRAYHPITHNLFFSNTESIFTKILTLKGWDSEVTFLEGNPLPFSREGSRNRRLLFQAIKAIMRKSQRLPRIYSFILASLLTKGKNLRALIIKKALLKRKNIRVFISNRNHNWDCLIEDLLLNNIIPLWRCENQERLTRDISGIDSKAFLESTENDENFRELFIWGDLDIFPILKDRIEFIISDGAKLCLGAYNHTLQNIEKYGIKAILSSSRITGVEHSICLAAKHVGVPVITWQHGGLGACDHYLAPYNDLMGSDKYFVFGDGVCQWLKEYEHLFNTNLVPTGSAFIEKPIKTKRKTNTAIYRQFVSLVKRRQSIICLYATTNYFGNLWYLNTNIPFSDRKFFISQKKIIQFLQKFGQVATIFKLNPNPLHENPPLLSLLRLDKTYVVKNEYSFDYLCDIADIIVIDYPWTAILEAISTDKPVFVLLEQLDFFEESRAFLSRRAICADNTADLLMALESYIGRGIYPADIKDNTFLLDYGLHLSDGRTKDRAIKELFRTIDAHASV